MMKGKYRVILYWVLITIAIVILSLNLYRHYVGDPIKPLLYTGKTQVNVINPIANLGKRQKGSKVETLFRLVNTGKSPFIIKAVVTECHCTKPSYSSEPVMPGDTTIITVQYDSNIPGFFQKKLLVNYYGQDSPIMLIFRGEII